MPFSRKLYKTLSQCSASSPVTTSVDENGRAWLATLPTLPTQRSTFGKDTRAYEYERQRIKKAADFVKMRSRKARGAEWTGNKGHQSSASVASATLSGKGRQLQEEEDENDDLEGLVLFDSRQENTGVTPFMTEPSPHPPRYEVRLADFVRMGKPRKPKGECYGYGVPRRELIVS